MARASSCEEDLVGERPSRLEIRAVSDAAGRHRVEHPEGEVGGRLGSGWRKSSRQRSSAASNCSATRCEPARPRTKISGSSGPRRMKARRMPALASICAEVFVTTCSICARAPPGGTEVGASHTSSRSIRSISERGSRAAGPRGWGREGDRSDRDPGPFADRLDGESGDALLFEDLPTCLEHARVRLLAAPLQRLADLRSRSQTSVSS